MSYEIFYDKRFIKVGEDQFIPIFQTGSNNCWEAGWSGRDIPEKNWHCLNYPHRDRFIFSESELMDMADKSKGFSNAKSRGKYYTEDEFVRLYKNGVRGSKTLEFYIELGNAFEVRDTTDYRNIKCEYPKTTKELLKMIEELKEKNSPIGLGFNSRELYLPKRNSTIQKEKVMVEQDHYYVLANKDNYFCGLRKYGYVYDRCISYLVKKFKKEKEANRYLKKYNNGRLKDFEVKKIEELFSYYK